ncbi:MAG: outer membrane lipoprotein carrier protein [Sodalis sp. Psp]|nr:outer membrane lipoprotein carrier protein [Sodalis sp. Psp]MCR3757359.1 outer membrane lipoprotein carrier protein [Sodalis sp. Ppy]
MKKCLITTLFTAVMAVPVIAADDAYILQSRLNRINSFYANFIQRITSAAGDTVQEGKGELWVKRPNLFNWHMISPDESVLVSDGKTLWFYNPFVEQATASWLKNATGNSLFMLITGSSAADWCQYNVKQQGDNFSLVPKSDNGNLKQFTIQVTADGTIGGFTAVEQDGQNSAYQLKNQQNDLVDDSKFHFTLPKGVMLDDQR